MSQRSTSALDLITLLAVGVLVYAIKNFLHEAVGHGGVCVLVGGDPVALSSAWWDATYEGVSPWGRRMVKAGGTLVNVAVGVLLMPLWFSAKKKLPQRPWLAFFLWLLIVVNLLSGGGYAMVDPLGGFGDWAAFLKGLQPQQPIRFSIVAAGAAVSLIGVRFGAKEIRVFMGNDRKRMWMLCVGPYLAGSAVLLISAIFNPYGPEFIITTALANLAGTIWLVCFLPFLVKGEVEVEAVELPRAPVWIGAGGLAAIVVIAVLGPAIQF